MRAAHAVAPEVARVLSQCRKRMFKPRLTNLFEALVIGRAAAHAIKILRNDRVIGLRQRKLIEVFRACVTRSGPDCETNLRSSATELLHRWQITDDDIRTRRRSNSRLVQRRHA